MCVVSTVSCQSTTAPREQGLGELTGVKQSGLANIASIFSVFLFLDIFTDLVPLLDSFIDILREGFSVDESAPARCGLQPSFLVDHFAPGNGDHWDSMTLHALKDVVVHSLVVRLG